MLIDMVFDVVFDVDLNHVKGNISFAEKRMDPDIAQQPTS
jgi:hypothetical protein